MPKPNCTLQNEPDVGVIDFGLLGRRKVEGRFDGGSMTSDAGVMLLAQVDRKLGLADAAARCIADPRNPFLIVHAVRDMLRQRVYVSHHFAGLPPDCLQWLAISFLSMAQLIFECRRFIPLAVSGCASSFGNFFNAP